MDEFRKYIPTYLRVMRSISLYFLFLLIFTVARFCAGDMAGIAVVLMPLTLHSTARVFGETDRHLCELALLYREERDVHHRSPREILRLVLSSRMLRIELGILLFLPILLPIEMGYGPLASLLFGGAAVSRALKKLVVMAIVLPLYFGIWLLSRYSAVMWWAYEMEYDEGNYFGSLVLKLLGIGAIYALGGFLSAFFVPVFISAYYIVRAIVQIRWWLPLLLVLGAIALWWLWGFWRACRIRRRFFKRLEVVLREQGATISHKKRLYRSLIRLSDEVNFIVTHGEKTYYCKLFATLKRHTPLYFSERGIVQRLHSFRFRRVEYFRYTAQFDFSFEADGTKALIVTPVPKELYAGDTSFNRLIDTGESVGDYKVFTASGFLGALSRDVVDR